MNPSPYQSRRIWPGRVAPVSPTAFTLTANLSGKVAGVRVSAVASTSAKRLGDVCPMEVQKLK